MRPDSSTLIRLRCVVVAGATASAVDHLKMADEEKAPVVSVTTQTQRHTARSLSGHDAEIPPAEVATRHRKPQAAKSVWLRRGFVIAPFSR